MVSVTGLLNISELDPIKRYLPAAERPRPSSRYSSFQVLLPSVYLSLSLIEGVMCSYQYT